MTNIGLKKTVLQRLVRSYSTGENFLGSPPVGWQALRIVVFVWNSAFKPPTDLGPAEIR